MKSVFTFIVHLFILNLFIVGDNNVSSSPIVVADDAVKTNLIGETGSESINFKNHPNFPLLPNPESGDECGLRISPDASPAKSRVRRLVGARPAKTGEFPWMTQIIWLKVSDHQNHLTCGGSIINSRYILTAAHCVTRVDAGYALTFVTMGSTTYPAKYRLFSNCSDTSSYKFRNNIACSAAVDEVIVHENYLQSTNENDIALIRLESPLDFTNLTHIRPICLPFHKDTVKLMNPDEQLEIAGWGRTDAYFDDTYEAASSLNKLKLHLSTPDHCDDFYSMYGKTGENRICVIGDHERAACNGDSGSPITFKSNFVSSTNSTEITRKSIQIGIMSLGGNKLHCGRQGKPAVLTNVVEYMPWILNKIRA